MGPKALFTLLGKVRVSTAVVSMAAPFVRMTSSPEWAMLEVRYVFSEPVAMSTPPPMTL